MNDTLVRVTFLPEGRTVEFQYGSLPYGHHGKPMSFLDVAEHFDIRLAVMTSKRRPENIAFPRQIAMYLSRQMTESSLNTIGEAYGGRDHGTVLHACRLVKDRMEVDANVRQVVNYLEKQLLR